MVKTSNSGFKRTSERLSHTKLLSYLDESVIAICQSAAIRKSTALPPHKQRVSHSRVHKLTSSICCPSFPPSPASQHRRVSKHDLISTPIHITSSFFLETVDVVSGVFFSSSSSSFCYLFCHVVWVLHEHNAAVLVTDMLYLPVIKKKTHTKDLMTYRNLCLLTIVATFLFCFLH